MSQDETNPPLAVQAPPDPADREFAPLLAEPFARAWDVPGMRNTRGDPAPVAPAAHPLRGRLLARLAASHAAEAPMRTARRNRVARETLAPGVVAQTLYQAQPGTALRPGEPLLARLVELAPGTTLTPALLGAPQSLRTRHREWLVLDGRVRGAGQTLGRRDYHIVPAGFDTPGFESADGALLFVRESALAANPGDAPATVRDAETGWPDFAPGLQRRVLWQRDGQAALLYYAQPGAEVPQHSHGHDEECLMLQGELFLDDLLLRPGDYQLAPAGTGHRVTATDTGVVIYAHGDLELRFV